MSMEKFDSGDSVESSDSGETGDSGNPCGSGYLGEPGDHVVFDIFEVAAFGK